MESIRSTASLERLAPEILANIAKNLLAGCIFSMTLTSRTMFYKVNPTLYSLDLEKEEPLGLSHAVRQPAEDLALAILARYSDEKLSGKINTTYRLHFKRKHIRFTALHAAAANDHIRLVRKLHSLGAKPSAVGYNLPTLLGPKFRRKLNQFPKLKHHLFEIEWMPNFAPIILGCLRMYLLLDDLYPSGIVAKSMPQDARNNQSAGSIRDPRFHVMTLHHLACIIDSPDLLKFAIDRRNHVKHLAAGIMQSSALHLAAGAGSLSVIPQLTKEQIGISKVSILDGLGETPLHIAVEAAIGSKDGKERSKALKVIEALFAAGFTPGHRQAGKNLGTSLHIVGYMLRRHWSENHRVIRKVLKMLFRREREIEMRTSLAEQRQPNYRSAMINLTNSLGETLLNQVAEEIINKGGNTSLEKLFMDLVVFHNADVNLNVNLVPIVFQNPRSEYRVSIITQAVRSQIAGRSGLNSFIQVLRHFDAASHPTDMSHTDVDPYSNNSLFHFLHRPIHPDFVEQTVQDALVHLDHSTST
ncbi:hypothetical protein F66182_9986 [Fusarium sp. NRRL 66182]|nr:hypothetical protein F66182_9986 [Fusarium sp. NRRL 66182]